MPRGSHTGGDWHTVSDAIWKPHATVAALCENQGRFLLVQEQVNGDIVFNQPAGHLEQGESLIEAVIRETREETQYEFTPTGLLGIYRFMPDDAEDLTYLRFLFCGRVGKQLNGQLDDGIIAAEWMSYEQIKSCQARHRSPMVMQCIDDYLDKTPCSLDLLSPHFN